MKNDSLVAAQVLYLLNHRPCSAPSCVLEEKKERVVVCRSAFVIGPIDKHSSANHQITRNETPVTTIFAVIAIITHYKITFGRNDYLFTIALKFEDVVIIIHEVWSVIYVVRLPRFARRGINNLERIFPIMVYRLNSVLRDYLSVDY